MLLAFHKPYGVLSQFTPDGSRHHPLAEFVFPPGVYPLGRLDAESEGLLLLSDEGGLNARLLHPERGHLRTYWAQVERVPSREALGSLEQGAVIGGRKTLPCHAWLLEPQPEIPPRVPPIRFRKNVPEAWIALELTEGKNHQVRRMTASIGHPTLRLVRVKIGDFALASLAPGKWRELSAAERAAVFGEGDLADRSEVAAASSRFSEHQPPSDCQATPRTELQVPSPLFLAFDPAEPVANISGHLPHWRQPGTTYFVTFRTVDSLPREKLDQWQSERAEWLRAHPEPHSDDERKDYFHRFPQRFQHWLDQGYGACALARAELKRVVEEALRHFDGQRYQLGEFVVMPNHVHVLVTPFDGYELSAILHSWKSYTASAINRRLGCTGAFWQKESFDHIVRNADSLEGFAQYIRNNPRK